MSDFSDRLRDLARQAYEAANDGMATLGLSIYNYGTRDTDAAAAAARAIGPKAEPTNSDDNQPDTTTMRGYDIRDFQLGGSTYDWYQRQTSTDRSRRARYADFEQMNSESPELYAAAQVISRNLVSSEDGDETTYVTGSDDKNVKRIMDDMDERTNLPRRIQTYAHEGIKLGDAFVELSVGQERRPLIWGFNELPTGSMNRIQPHGRLEGFEQVNSSGNAVNCWEPWEICHFRNNRPFGQIYGQSIFFPIRKAWKQVAALEDGTVIMVLERASQVRVHTVPVPNDRTQQGSAMNDYKVRNRRKRSYNTGNSTLNSNFNPMDSAEVYVPVPVGQDNYPPNIGVTTLDGQANFKEVITVDEYFQRKLLIPLGVPPSYISLEKETRSRAVNTAQEIEFGRMLRQMQSTYAQAIKKHIYALQLRFAYGKDIPGTEYWVEFPRPSKVDDKVKAEITKIQAEAAEKLGRQFNLPLDTIMVAFFGWSEDEAAILVTDTELPSAETEGLGKRAEKTLLADIRREVAGNSERARDLGTLLDTMADAAEYLSEKPVRV